MNFWSKMQNFIFHKVQDAVERISEVHYCAQRVMLIILLYDGYYIGYDVWEFCFWHVCIYNLLKWPS